MPATTDFTQDHEQDKIEVMEISQEINPLIIADNIIQEVRREANNKLLDVINGKIDEYNSEDLMRLVGELNATHNHIEAAIASDNDIYCVLKHLATAIVLCGECFREGVLRLYAAMSYVTGGKIKPCLACKREEN